MNNIDVEIKSFGKIKQAKLSLKPFTVIAGKNASGKSFITRALYSVFSSLNKDHLSIEVDLPVRRIKHCLLMARVFTNAPSRVVSESLESITGLFDGMATRLAEVFHQSTFAEQLVQTDMLMAEILFFKNECQTLSNDIGSVKKYGALKKYFSVMSSETKKLETLIKNPKASLAESLGRQLEHSLFSNFQVANLGKLKNNSSTKNDEVIFNFGQKIGEIKLVEKGVNFELETAGIDKFQRIENVVYLESPVYWKIKDVLKDWVKSRENPQLRRQLKHQKNELKKIPDYILDTFTLLDTPMINNQSFPELEKLAIDIKQCIGGGINISEGGELKFTNQNEKGENHSVDLHQSATGSISLGIISLLLEKKIIVPNSVLIIDEPEVNLHPAWQQVMIQVLYKLSLAGVRIVMASHSYDMMESIEKMMDMHEKTGDVGEHFSIVQLEDGQTINEDKPVFKKLSAVKADLGMPLFDLFSS